VLPSEINVPHDNDGLDPQEDEEVDRKDNGAGAEDHGWMVDDGFGEVKPVSALSRTTNLSKGIWINKAFRSQ